MADEAETLLAIASQGGGSSGSSAATQLVAAFASSLNDESSQQSVEAASATRNILSASLLSTVSLLATAPSNEDEGASDPSIEIPQEVMEMVGSGLAAVTAKPEEMTSSSLSSSFEAVEMLSSSTGAISQDAIQSLAGATSNLLAATSQGTSVTSIGDAQKYAKATLNVVDKLSAALVRSSVVGEKAMQVSTTNFDIAAKKDYASSFEGSAVPVSADSPVSIVVPKGAFAATAVAGRRRRQLGTDSAVDMKITAWTQDP